MISPAEDLFKSNLSKLKRVGRVMPIWLWPDTINNHITIGRGASSFFKLDTFLRLQLVKKKNTLPTDLQQNIIEWSLPATRWYYVFSARITRVNIIDLVQVCLINTGQLLLVDGQILKTTKKWKKKRKKTKFPYRLLIQWVWIKIWRAIAFRRNSVVSKTI